MVNLDTDAVGVKTLKKRINGHTWQDKILRAEAFLFGKKLVSGLTVKQDCGQAAILIMTVQHKVLDKSQARLYNTMGDS